MAHIWRTARRSTAAGAGALLLIAGLAACGSNETLASTSTDPTSTGAGTGAAAGTDSTVPTATPSPAPKPAAKLQIKKNAVSPGKLTVGPGQKVQIVNSDSVTHELVDTKNKISTGNIKTNGTGALTAPTKAGTFQLVDPHHSATKLTLVVS